MSKEIRPRSCAVATMRAQTEMHPGTGTGSGAIDLCIQRETHTGWPAVYASALKGILRAASKGLADDDRMAVVFGREGDDERPGMAGTLSVTDAAVLAFPVSAVRGVFAWVTCQAVVERLRRLLEGVGITEAACPPRLTTLSNDHAVVTSDGNHLTSVLADERQVVLRDLAPIVSDRGQESLDSLAQWIERHFARFENEEGTLFDPKRSLVQVSDEHFTYLTRFATSVTTHNALEEDTRTVKKGALFSQENLPAETLLYFLCLDTPRGNGAQSAVAFIEEHLDGQLIQAGADDTKGKGLCWLRLTKHNQA